MGKMMEYRVVRQHEGDQVYTEGSTRIAAEDEVKHLVPKTLELIGPAPDQNAKAEAPSANKAESAPQNKAEAAAPANKSEAPAKPVTTRKRTRRSK